LLAAGYTRRAIGKTPMKMRASRIERLLEKVEAMLVPPPRKWLRAIIDDGDDEAEVKEKKEKALAEHVAVSSYGDVARHRQAEIILALGKIGTTESGGPVIRNSCRSSSG
jgi:hypothetical protein